MSRQSKGPRLYLRKAKRDESGNVTENARWIIRDGSRTVGTGCGPSEIRDAEKKLQAYIAAKHAPERKQRCLDEIRIADVLSIYADDVVPGLARPGIIIGQCERLNAFFGDKTLAHVTGSLCRAYAESRAGQGHSKKGTGGGARRDLQTLAAAINHHHREGLHRETVRVVLPPRGEARKRWLSRGEVRRLWKAAKERGADHVARFVLFGAFTGSRPGALLSAYWDDRKGAGWVDLEHGVFHSHASGERVTAKRQPPVPLYAPLRRLMRLWAARDGFKGPVIRFEGKPVLNVKTAMQKAVQAAGLTGSVTGYTLRHTAGSWLVQRGVSTRKAAEILGTSDAIIERHYGHFAQDHLREAVASLGNKQSVR